MKIVSVTHYFPSRKGGIEAVAYEINRRLAKLGHEVEWFASAPIMECEHIPGLNFRPVNAINLIERLVGLPLPIWLSREVVALWSEIRICDVVHLHDFIYPGSMLALMFGRMCGKRVVLTQHVGDIPYKSKALSWLLTAVNRSVGSFALKRASQVVFISNAVEAYFRSFTRFQNRPEYIPNGVDWTVFSPVSECARDEIRRELGVGINGRLVCLFVGRFVEKKGLALLSRVVQATPCIEWLFAGEGPLHPASWNAPNVRVFEGWRREKLAQLYRAADMLVLPSRGEGFPLVVQEAFACGTPACVSDETAAGCVAARSFVFELPVTGSDSHDIWSKYLTGLCLKLSALNDERATVSAFARKTWNWDVAVDRYLGLYAGAFSESC